jgi:hypothetical protein
METLKNYGGRNVRSTRAAGGMRAPSQRWPSRTSILPGGVGITTNMFDAVEEFLEDFGHSINAFRYGEMALVQLLAKTSQGFAQGMSRGPVDPRMTNTAAAWRMPVRRITSRYYQGWKVRRIAPNIWEMYNEAREAYFIEYGIHPSPNRIRRPIRKLAALKTLNFAAQTRVAHRLLDMSLGGKGRGLARTMPQSPGASFWTGFTPEIRFTS